MALGFVNFAMNFIVVSHYSSHTFMKVDVDV